MAALSPSRHPPIVAEYVGRMSVDEHMHTPSSGVLVPFCAMTGCPGCGIPACSAAPYVV